MDPIRARRAGEEIEIESAAGALRAYLAAPPVGAGRGVLVFEEGWGLGSPACEVCDRLARSGFMALAPDLDRLMETLGLDAVETRDAAGVGAGLGGEAGKVATEAAGAQAGPGLGVLIDALRRQPGTTGARQGSLGFGRGSGLALRIAVESAEVGAVVHGDGVGRDPIEGLESCRVAVLSVLSAEAAEGRDALEASGVERERIVHAGTRPGFLNAARPDRFDAEAAARAWRDIETFLDAELR